MESHLNSKKKLICCMYGFASQLICESKTAAHTYNTYCYTSFSIGFHCIMMKKCEKIQIIANLSLI